MRTLECTAGDIDFAEFVTLMAHKMADNKSEETLRSAFIVFDTDGSGKITGDEIARVLLGVGEEVTIEEVRLSSLTHSSMHHAASILLCSMCRRGSVIEWILTGTTSGSRHPPCNHLNLAGRGCNTALQHRPES